MGANPLALILAALVIAAAVIGTQFISHYQLVAFTGDGNAFAWRLNTRTGEVDYCAIYRDASTEPQQAKNPPPISGSDPFAKFGDVGPKPQFSVECKHDVSPTAVKP
jgi:hypothetical protein